VCQTLKAWGKQREVENGPRGAEGNIKQAVKDVNFICLSPNEHNTLETGGRIF
jgi:hypothetical protein